MTNNRRLELLSSGRGLLEGPVWHPQLGLLVAEADRGGVWSLGPEGLDKQQVPHRRGIGGMALHASGGVVVSGRNVAFKQLGGDDSPTVVLLQNDPARGIVGFNDLTTDPSGRIYVGSLGFVPLESSASEHRSGFLHVIDLDGSSRVVADDVMLTNGLGFSPDGGLLYHSDSTRQVVKVYRVHRDGSLGPPQIFASVSEGMPDGLAVAEDGSVWVALAHAHAVVRYSADGRELARIAIPIPMVTSLCFGGDDLRDLYVVTGDRGAPADTGACVYRMRADVPGLPHTTARVQVLQ